MKNYLKATFLIMLICVSIVSSAQINYKKGYFITNTNDTLHGKINDNRSSINATICLFKETAKSKVIKYHPTEIKAYRFFNDKYYVAKQIFTDGKPEFIFLDVLIEGKVNLYHYWGNSSAAFYIEKDGNLICLSNEDIIVQPTTVDFDTQITDPKFVIKSGAYRDSLITVFRDSKIIKNQIPLIDYKLNVIQNITKSYLKEVCKGENCINYERNLRTNKPTFGVFYGIRLNQISFLPSPDGINSINEPSTIKSNPFTTFPMGIFYNIPITRISERLSFQMELNYHNIDYYQEISGIHNFGRQVAIASENIGIPLLFKYEFLSARLSPSLAIGKETSFVLKSKVWIDEAKNLLLNHSQKGGMFFELGLRYKLTAKTSVFSNIRIQSNHNLIVKEEHKKMNYNDIAENDLAVKEFKTISSTLYVGLKF